MVKFLTALQRRINSLLQEREDHPGLQKLSSVLQMLLDIPSSTPLAKVFIYSNRLQKIMYQSLTKQLFGNNVMESSNAVVTYTHRINFFA